MKFKTEEERVKAMEGIDPLADDAESKLNEIASAEIGEDTEVSGEVKSEITETTTEGETPAEHKITDLKGYKTPGELLKAFDNLKDLVDRQAEKLRSVDVPRVDPQLVEKLEKTQKELDELKSKGGTQQAGDSIADLSQLEAERQKIDATLDDLDKQAEEDPDVVFTPEYQKKLREVQRLSVKNTAGYKTVVAQVHKDLSEVRKAHADSEAGRKKGDEESTRKAQEEAIDKEFDSLDDDEFKTTVPTKDLRQKYFNWQNDVCTAFYGRPAKTQEEVTMAMTQLQMGNPKLVQDCQMRKIPTVPDDQLSKYLKKCEINLYRQGYRKNAAGQFTHENRIMTPGPDGKMIPYIMPSLKDALDDMRLKAGDFQRRENDAYQDGARDFARASERRDHNLLNDRDHGGSTKDTDWAVKLLNGLDEVAIADAVSRGNKEVLVEVNEARKVLGLGPIAI